MVGTSAVLYNKKSLSFLQLEVWDTAGQERFRTITHSYYRNANGLILAYDITNCDSISGLSTWLNDVKLYASPDVITCLVGTKKDLESKREVSEEQAKTFAAKHSDIVDVIETSAKVNYNHDYNLASRAICKGLGARQ